MTQRKIAIIGAGPIGLEAALYALELGYKPTIFEKGDTVATNIWRWRHVQLFSPFKMNRSRLGLAKLRSEFPGWPEPEPEAFMTGKDYIDGYLHPLGDYLRSRADIRTNTEVVTIGRERIFKGDLIGSEKRLAFPFRILTVDGSGNEDIEYADIVLDASGVYHNPNSLGSGGIPCPGELKNRPHIHYHIPDVYGRDRGQFANKHTLLVGAGYSAATVARDFENLIREEPQTSLSWIIRDSPSQPILLISNDQLARRADLAQRANTIAASKIPQINFQNDTVVEAIAHDKQRRGFSVGLKCRVKRENKPVDRIIAMVGYGPENSIYRELQVHECYASRGPMKLAAALLGSASADCLTQGSMGAETLKNPEPGFYIIGNKSYGRNPTFLLKTGLSQIVEVFSLIRDQSDLNLYESESHSVGNQHER